jgi:hypothetical protein
MKALLYILIILAIIGGAFYVLSDKLENGEIKGIPSNEIDTYFKDRMIALGIEKVGHPIEGFDDNMLRLAFPELIRADFDGVKTFEGHYELQGSETIFVRDEVQPITSAERTISDEGYVALLQNVSKRLAVSIETKAQIDTLIETINTGERVSVHLNEAVSRLGVTVTPK